MFANKELIPLLQRDEFYKTVKFQSHEHRKFNNQYE